MANLKHYCSFVVFDIFVVFVTVLLQLTLLQLSNIILVAAV